MSAVHEFVGSIRGSVSGELACMLQMLINIGRALAHYERENHEGYAEHTRQQAMKQTAYIRVQAKIWEAIYGWPLGALLGKEATFAAINLVNAIEEWDGAADSPSAVKLLAALRFSVGGK